MEDFMGSCFAEGVAKQLVRTMGVVQPGEKQGLAVIRPSHAAIAVFKRQLGDRAAAQLFYKQAVGFFAASVQAVGQALVIGADTERPQRNKATIGQCIGVQQQMFGVLVHLLAVIGRARAAVVAWVFVACRGAGVIQVRTPRRRQGQIRLQDPALDFLEQGFETSFTFLPC